MRYVLHKSFICSISLARLPSSVQEQILEQNLKKTIEPREFVTGRRPGLSPEIRLAIGYVLLRTEKALQCGSCYSSPSLQSTLVKARASFLDSSETLPGISWVWSHLTRPPSEHPLPLSVRVCKKPGLLAGTKPAQAWRQQEWSVSRRRCCCF